MNSIAHRTDTTPAVSAVDSAPTGKAPFAAELHDRADESVTARDHFDDTEMAIIDGQLTPAGEKAFDRMARRLMAEAAKTSNPAATLAAIIEALPRIMPEVMAKVLAPLTAARRGTEWMAKYNCIPECVMDHAGADGVPGWHQTAAAVVAVPELAPEFREEFRDEPLIAARVTHVNQDAEAYGTHTRLWFDFAGHDTIEMDPQQARAFVTGMQQMLPQLAVLVDQLERIEAGDHDGDPDARARHEAEANARIRAVTEAHG